MQVKGQSPQQIQQLAKKMVEQQKPQPQFGAKIPMPQPKAPAPAAHLGKKLDKNA